MKRYTPQFKLHVLDTLDLNHGDVSLTARHFNIPRRTLAEWIKTRHTNLEGQPDDDQFKNLKTSEQLDQLAKQLVTSLPAKIRKAGLGETLRAISMIDELRKAARSNEEDNDATHQKLAELLNRKREAWEIDIFKRGGHAQLAAFKKAQAELEAFLERTPYGGNREE